MSKISDNTKNVRRSTRIGEKVREDLTKIPEHTSPKKTKKSESKSNNYCFIDDSLKKALEQVSLNEKLPTELFDEHDVDGKNMYSVNNTSIRKSTTVEKVKICKDSINIDKLNRKRELKLSIERLPGDNYRCIEKNKNLGSHKNKSHNHSVSSSNEDKINSSKGNDQVQIKETNDKQTVKDSNVESSSRVTRSKAKNDYHLQAENYFAIQSEKSVTSNNTLGKLKNRHLDEEKLQQLLANNCHISKEHQLGIKKITSALEGHYEEWLYTMEEGFTVLLYGIGSKRLLINNFREKMIPDEPALVINGFFPSLTIKEILDNIVTELLGLESISNQNDCFDIIKKTMSTHSDDRFYLLFHNLDGGMLRSNKAQDILSRLASIPNIHVLASVDHINAPLIWDNVKRARYNFYWVEAPTFLPYEAETSYESSLLVQKSGTLALLSLQNVFASLTSNAKNIYIILVKYQLENDGKNYSGMAFKDLYRASREAFLVPSDQALRAQLTEFNDHKLIKSKRNIDGVETLVIPLDNALLKQFLEQQDQA